MNSPDNIAARRDAILAQTVVWEDHCCPDFDDPAGSMPNLARYRAARFSLVAINAGDARRSFEQNLEVLTQMREWLHAHPAEYVLAESVDDVLHAKREGKLAICFNVEGAYSIDDDLSRVARYHELGVRWMALVYNRANRAGSGVHDEVDNGLTAFGRDLVAEMERVGMVVDIAHTGYRTALDVCEVARAPVTISHSNPRALTDHPRCVPDDVMRACAATGGVLGISGVGLFLGNDDISAENVLRSIDYAVEVMGVDHVGIGTDFGFQSSRTSEVMVLNDAHIWPPGHGYDGRIRFVPPERIPEVAELMLRRGYADADVGKILGGNFLRVARQVWK